MPPRLDVYKKEIFCGTLTRTKHGCIFEYDHDYLKLADTKSGIAFHLPHARHRTETHGVNLHTFFAGLLPEGIRLRALVKKVKTSEDDLFALLAVSGADCVGDVSVMPHGNKIAPAQPTVSVRSLSKVDFGDFLKKSLGFHNLYESTIPGVQEKISAAMISFPVRSRSKSGQYILKLNPPEREKLVENENFFIHMANDCGLLTASAKLVFDCNKTPGLLVERFDRELNLTEKKVKKLHLEDACQFLDRYSADKYQLSCKEIAEGIRRLSSSPAVEIARFLQTLAFSYLIGNGDHHAKNISLLESDGLIRLSPSYDVLSTIPYGDQRMALKFEGRDLNLKRKHFLEFANRFDVSSSVIKSYLDQMCEKSEPWIPKLGMIDFDERITRHLKKTIMERRKGLS